MSSEKSTPDSAPGASSDGPAEPNGPAARPEARIVFDDPLSMQSGDDTDSGWGERPRASGDSAADLARFLDEKPPHHI